MTTVMSGPTPASEPASMVTVKLCDCARAEATTRAGTRADPEVLRGRGQAVVLLEAVAVEAGELDLAA